MKKTLSALVLIAVLAILAVPMAALAQPKTECTLKHNVTGINSACTANTTVCDPQEGTCSNKISAWGACCTVDAVYTATDWVFTILMAIVVIFIMLGAFNIVTAGGNTEKVSAGRSYIIYALVGLAVALLAKALPSVVQALLGV